MAEPLEGPREGLQRIIDRFDDAIQHLQQPVLRDSDREVLEKAIEMLRTEEDWQISLLRLFEKAVRAGLSTPYWREACQLIRNRVKSNG